MIFHEHGLAHQLLNTLHGLEIGAAAHNPFGLNTRNVAPMDDFEFYARAQAEMGTAPVSVDIWAMAEDIPVPDDSEDFVLSSHVVEHLPNLIAALVEWNRIVRVGGYIFMIVPLPDALPGDRNRPVTTLTHLIEDYQLRRTLDTHPTEGVPGGRMGHYHVLTPDLFLELIDWLRDKRLCDWSLVAREDVDSKVGNGFTLVFRITAKFAAPLTQPVGNPLEPAEVESQWDPCLGLAPALAALVPQPDETTTPSKIIGIFGTFEVENYGDQLFPILLERALQQDMPGVQLRLFSPNAGTYIVDGRPIYAIANIGTQVDALDGYVIGGGDIIRFDRAHTQKLKAQELVYADLFLLPSLMGSLRQKPVVWNAPGVPMPFTPDQQKIVEGMTALSTYLSVRDQPSRAYLGTGANHAAIVPDTGFWLAECFPRAALAPLLVALQARFCLPPAYLVAHLSPATARDEDWQEAGEALVALSKRCELSVVLIPLGPVHGEVSRLQWLQKQHPKQLLLLEAPLHPLAIAAIIAHASIFLGTSLHGGITAFAYNVPAVLVNTRQLAKLDRFGQLTGRAVLSSWRELLQGNAILPQEDAAQHQTVLLQQLQAHLSAVSNALLEREQTQGKEPDGSKLVQLLLQGIQPRVEAATTSGWQECKLLDEKLWQANQQLEQQTQQIATQYEKLVHTELQLCAQAQTLETLTNQVEAEYITLGWRLLQTIRSLRDVLFPRGDLRWQIYLGLRSSLDWSAIIRSSKRFQLHRSQPKRSWMEHRQPVDRRRKFHYQPVISLITPVYNIDAVWLRAMIESVRQQLYPHWELCLVNDCATDPHVATILDRYAALDARIRVQHLTQNEGIVGASNYALNLATGEFSALLDHDDLLTANALLEVVAQLNIDTDLDLIYSDEDKIDADGKVYDPVLKPDWNPTLLLACNYICHLGVYRTALLREIGGFRTTFDGSQDYDLLLRFTERTEKVAHIPKILYHWRASETSTALSASAKPYAYAAACRALQEAMQRRGCAAHVEMRSPGHYRVHRPVSPASSVAIIIDWSERRVADVNTLKHILSLTTQIRDIELILIVPETDSLPTVHWLPHVHVVPLPATQSVGQRFNTAAAQSQSDYLVFLDSNLYPLHSDWLEALLEQMQPNVAVVSGRMLGANGRLLHSGLVLDRDHLPRSSSDYQSIASINYLLYVEAVRNCSAVGQGYQLVLRAAFEVVGGFAELYQQAYHDIDLCLQLKQKGWQIIYTPWAVMQRSPQSKHAFSPSPQDEQLFQKTWQATSPACDPFFNPGFSRQ